MVVLDVAFPLLVVQGDTRRSNNFGRLVYWVEFGRKLQNGKHFVPPVIHYY